MAGGLQNIGPNVLTFGPISMQYGPKGMVTNFTVTCPTAGPLITYYNYIIQFGASGTLEGLDVGSDGITSAEVKKLTVSLPGLVNNLGSVLNELLFDSWELLTNEGTDSIFANPLIVGITGWLNANDKDVLSEVATKQLSLTDAVTQADTDVTANAPHHAPTDGRSLQILKELLKGQSEYEAPNYVLRHTSYCSASSLYNTSVAGTQLIYSTAQLLSEVGHGWVYNLPARLISVISSIPVQFAASDEAPYYQWGWLKTISRQPVLANFLVETNTEYSLALWSSLRYASR